MLYIIVTPDLLSALSESTSTMMMEAEFCFVISLFFFFLLFDDKRMLKEKILPEYSFVSTQ